MKKKMSKMKKRLIAILALVLVVAFVLAAFVASGPKDPIAELARIRTEAEKEYQTVLATYEGGKVTVLDILAELSETLSMYAYYGIEPTEDVVGMTQASIVEYHVSDAALCAHAEELGVSLTEEDIAELDVFYEEAYQSIYQNFYASATGQTDEIRAAETDLNIFLMGYDHDAYIGSQSAMMLAGLVADAVRAQVTEVDEAALLTAYEDQIAADEELYADNYGDFEKAMASGVSILWYPEGYRTIKQIFIQPDEVLMNAVNEAKREVEALAEDIAALEGELAAINDDDTDQNPDDVQVLINELTVDYNTAVETLAAAEAALLASVQPELDAIYERLDAGEDFDALVQEFNDDPAMNYGFTKENGYCVSPLSKTWDTAFKNSALLLENIGEFSDPVITGSGVHVLLYTGDLTPGPVPFEQARESLAATALETAQEEHYQATLAEWVAELNPSYSTNAWSMFSSKVLQ